MDSSQVTIHPPNIKMETYTLTGFYLFLIIYAVVTWPTPEVPIVHLDASLPLILGMKSTIVKIPLLLLRQRKVFLVWGSCWLSCFTQTWQAARKKKRGIALGSLVLRTGEATKRQSFMGKLAEESSSGFQREVKKSKLSCAKHFFQSQTWYVLLKTSPQPTLTPVTNQRKQVNTNTQIKTRSLILVFSNLKNTLLHQRMKYRSPTEGK